MPWQASQLASILDAQPEPVCQFDRDRRMIYCNQAEARVMNRPLASLIGQRWDHLGVSSAFKRAFGEQLSQVLAAGQPLTVSSTSATTGPYRDFEYTLTPIIGPNGEVESVISTVHDVTERRQAEENRSRLAAIVESSDDAIVGTTLEGCITSWNPGAERTFGYSADELIGQPDSLLHANPADGELEDHLSRICREERIEHHETVRRRKNGTLFPFSVTYSAVRDQLGHIIGVSAIGRDISQRKLQQDRLTSERERLQQVIDVMPEGVIVADATGVVVSANATARSIVGRDPTGISIPVTPTAPVAWTDPEGVPVPIHELPLQRSLMKGEEVRGVQLLTHHLEDSQETAVLASAVPLRDRNGQITGAVGVYQDISRLREIERMRDEWISIVAHDLRQPITVINGYLDLAIRHIEHSGDLNRLRELIRHVHEAANGISKMVDDLLDVSRITTRRLVVEPRTVDLRQLVEDIVARTAILTAGHSVRLASIGNIPSVDVDPVRLEQVITNLLANAATYGAEKSDIVIRIERDDRFVEVSVTNRGVGIPPSQLPRVFTRFYRTRAATEKRAGGLGLGLYISKGLVEAHSGTMRVESIPNETTTFTIALPYPSQPNHSEADDRSSEPRTA